DGVGIGSIGGLQAGLAVTYDADSVDATVALLGDANLDGMIDTGDLAILAANFDATGQTWVTADFTGDGTVGTADLAILAANFGAEVPEAATGAVSAAVPEPGVVGVAGAGLLAFLRRRGR
ncbi:MAG: dockerin type I domain-containing protein, partial [Planctomycetota bacterium]